MRYEETKELDEEKFRRLTGVKKSIFKRIVEILDEEDRRTKAKKIKSLQAKEWWLRM